ncbi:MAG: helix-hairpin-helix domain-containing protein, partial [Crocinitomicaceae bacterium]
HHRNRRSKNAFISEISEIKGIGEKTFEQLMKQFKTISAIKNATKEELIKTIGLSKSIIILNYFKEK